MALATKQLLQLLGPDRPLEVRCATALVLGEAGVKDAEATRALCDALQDPQPALRLQAIKAVGKLRVEQALPRLLERIKEGGEEAEQAALAAARAASSASSPPSLMRSSSCGSACSTRSLPTALMAWRRSAPSPSRRLSQRAPATSASRTPSSPRTSAAAQRTSRGCPGPSKRSNLSVGTGITARPIGAGERRGVTRPARRQRRHRGTRSVRPWSMLWPGSEKVQRRRRPRPGPFGCRGVLICTHDRAR